MIKMENMPLAETFNEASAPDFRQVEGAYIINAKDKHFNAGMYKVIYDAKNSADKVLNISVPYRISGEKASPRVMVSFLDTEGKLIQSDYFIREANAFTLKKEIPQETEKIKLEMLLYSFGNAEVSYGEPVVKLTEKTPHRLVRVASGYIKRKGNLKDNFQNTLKVIEKAAKSPEKPDILCFTECVLDVGCGEKYYITESSEEIREVMKLAKEYEMYVIFTSHEIDGQGYKYNTSFLIDNQGKLTGKYRKVFLTGMGELKGGLTPGQEFPVFDTPIGKIGMLICWDQWFPEGARELAQNGAEMIFWSTRGFHEPRVLTRAMDTGCYVIVSHPNPSNCGIVEPANGTFIARADSREEQGFVSCVIDLDERLNSQYKSFGRKGCNDREMFLSECELF